MSKIYIDNLLIERVAKTKFVRVIITENLVWDSYKSNDRNEVSKGMRIICKISHIINLNHVYFTPVYLCNEYYNMVWA